MVFIGSYLPAICKTLTHTNAGFLFGGAQSQSPVGGHFFTRHFALRVMAPFNKKRMSAIEVCERNILNGLNGSRGY